MAIVYWLHIPEHCEPNKEGYVGVTINGKNRYRDHLSALRSGLHENIHLTYAYLKYNKIVYSILYEGTEKECYKKEEELRPKENIGWNINKGGSKPPTMLGENSPTKRPEVKAKIGAKTSVAMKKWWAENREIGIAKAKEAHNRPEVRAAHSARRREQWKNPEYRAKQTIAHSHKRKS